MLNAPFHLLQILFKLMFSQRPFQTCLYCKIALPPTNSSIPIIPFLINFYLQHLSFSDSLCFVYFHWFIFTISYKNVKSKRAETFGLFYPLVYCKNLEQLLAHGRPSNNWCMNEWVSEWMNEEQTAFVSFLLSLSNPRITLLVALSCFLCLCFAAICRSWFYNPVFSEEWVISKIVWTKEATSIWKSWVPLSHQCDTIMPLVVSV